MAVPILDVKPPRSAIRTTSSPLRAGGRLAATIAVLALAAWPAAASAASETLTFAPEADTYVGSAAKTTTHGTSTGMWADASPQRQAFVRFGVAGLGGRPVLSVKLRLRQIDASPAGGRVFSMSTTSWSESINWKTRPAIDGSLLASFGAVTAGSSYEVELGTGAARDGVVSYAIDSTNSDGSRWATRESSTPPQLLVTVENPPAPAPAPAPDPTPSPDPAPAPAVVLDGLSQVAASTVGSSEPTYYSANHRLAMTGGGRLLVVYGRHSSGVQLAWRDPAGSWQTRTTGGSADGSLLSGTGTGDWPASIAVASDSAGRQHAWAIWSGPNVGGLRPVQMRRLTDLDSPNGPSVGPVVTVDSPALGAYKSDIGFERAPDGTMRGCILYSRRVSDTTYELTALWFTDLASETPALGERATLETTTSSAHFGSLVQSAAGLRAVTRAGPSGGSLRLYGHNSASALTSWFTGATGPALLSSYSTPSGVALANGEVLAVVEDDVANHASTAYRFSPSGLTGAAELRLSGLAQPTVASDGTNAWMVGARQSDGLIVSRSYSPSAGWSASDRVEVGAGAGGRLAWPNALRDADGRLRLIAEGPGSPSDLNTSSVWAFQRPL